IFFAHGHKKRLTRVVPCFLSARVWAGFTPIKTTAYANECRLNAPLSVDNAHRFPRNAKPFTV
ncbi:MAG: hypothetical protein Q7T91_12685, partial [Sulfuricurvum sp.]|nr:hypothetical protein [Sulfuricurvum sp.]